MRDFTPDEQAANEAGFDRVVEQWLGMEAAIHPDDTRDALAKLRAKREQIATDPDWAFLANMLPAYDRAIARYESAS